MRQALLGGFAASRVLEVHGERMLTGNYKPGFRARLYQKDLRLATEAASSNNVAMPATAIVAQLINALVASGGGGTRLRGARDGVVSIGWNRLNVTHHEGTKSRALRGFVIKAPPLVLTTVASAVADVGTNGIAIRSKTARGLRAPVSRAVDRIVQLRFLGVRHGHHIHALVPKAQAVHAGLSFGEVRSCMFNLVLSSSSHSFSILNSNFQTVFNPAAFMIARFTAVFAICIL